MAKTELTRTLNKDEPEQFNHRLLRRLELRVLALLTPRVDEATEILARIKHSCLYRLTHTMWEEYCQDNRKTWGIGRGGVDKRIRRWIRKQRKSAESHIYFVAQPRQGLIKIGLSSNVKARFRDLESLSPVGLMLYASIPGDKADERYIHKAFSHLHNHGEWFEYRDELRTFVETLMSPWAPTEWYDVEKLIENIESARARQAERMRANRREGLADSA